MIQLKKALSVLAVSFLVTLSSCDPSGSSTSSQIYWNGVPLVFENVGDSGSWRFDLNSCESTFICRFDVYFSVYPSDTYKIYSTGFEDTNADLYKYEEDGFTFVRNDYDSGDGRNFKMIVALNSLNLYRLSIWIGLPETSGNFRVYVESLYK